MFTQFSRRRSPYREGHTGSVTTATFPLRSDSCCGGDGCASLEAPKTVPLRTTEDALLQVEDALLRVGKDHPTCVQVFNSTGVSCQVEAGFK